MITLTSTQLEIIKNWCNNYEQESLNWYDFEDSMIDNDNVKLTNGTTKGVFIFPDNDYVFKVEFADNDDEEACEREKQIYAEAEAAGLERFFAKTTLYSVINGVNIYAQPKLTTPAFDKDDTVKLSPGAQDLLSDCDDAYGLCENTLFEEFYVMYDVELLRQLIDFINENDINDLHSWNIGYTENNEPVFIDYCGYAG